MARAFKCDRCGKYYDGNKSIASHYKSEENHIFSIETVRKHNFTGCVNTDQRFDMCDDCLDLFFNYFMKSNRGENND